jgi:hypothetical protein
MKSFSLSLENLMEYENSTYYAIVNEELKKGNIEDVIFLIKKRVDKTGKIPEFELSRMNEYLIMEKRLDSIKKLWEMANEFGYNIKTGISMAVVSGDMEIFDFLKKSGAVLDECQMSQSDVLIKFGAKVLPDQKTRLLALTSAKSYESETAVFWSIVMERKEMFDELRSTMPSLPHSKINSCIEASAKSDDYFFQKIYEVEDIKSNLNKEFELENHKRYQNYKFIKKIAKLKNEDREKIFNAWSEKKIEGGDTLIKQAWESDAFRENLINSLPDKYIELTKRYKLTKLAEIDMQRIIKSDSFGLLEVISQSCPEALLTIWLDYPKEDRRLKRNIGPLLLSILTENVAASQFLGSIKNIFESEKQMIDDYAKNGWLLSRSREYGVYQSNQLSRNVEKRKETPLKLWESLKLHNLMETKKRPNNARVSI